MRRQLWSGAGLMFVAIGAIGAVLPLLPTVPFLLLALYCFARGNPVWEQRLLDNPRWGPPLRGWRERRVIPRKAKKAAIIAMGASVAVTAAIAGWPWAVIPVAVLILSGSWIWTRNE
jgi:uncharacterized membrane protein YbaN (DUF454 family)